MTVDDVKRDAHQKRVALAFYKTIIARHSGVGCKHALVMIDCAGDLWVYIKLPL